MFLLLLILAACSQEKYTLVENEFNELDKLKIQASKIKNSLKNKNGKEYLGEHDRYYNLMHKRTNKAMQYLNNTDPENLSNLSIIVQEPTAGATGFRQR